MKKFRSELGLEGLYRKVPQKSLDEIREIVDITENKRYNEAGEIMELDKTIPANKIYLFHSCIADAYYGGKIPFSTLLTVNARNFGTGRKRRGIRI